MTYQEVLWKDKYVWVVSLMSKSGKMHRYVRKYVGRGGKVVGEAKNGMLLIEFKNHTRCIPAGCVVEYGVQQITNRKQGGHKDA
jgi:hypothetical protein